MRRILLGMVTGLAIALVAIQLVPYGRAHTNPPVVAEPAWDSPQTRTAAVSACFDCHSNETEWPWYSNVAPFSWVLQRHVDEGREVLNFSEWGVGEQETEEIVESVESGDMPPFEYGLLHPSARLSAAELQTFIDGLIATFGERGGGEGEGH